MKLEYTKPELELELFEVEDVITLSVTDQESEEETNLNFGDINWQ